MSYGRVDLAAHIHLPTFFLLSGFCLTLGYSPLPHNSPCTSSTAFTLPHSLSPTTFYMGRLTRLAPSYLTSNLLGLLAWPGPGPVTLARTLLTFTATTTWFSMDNTYSVPAWTVTTLAFFYLVFPSLLAALHAHPSSHLSTMVVLLHQVQVVSTFWQIILSSTFPAAHACVAGPGDWRPLLG